MFASKLVLFTVLYPVYMLHCLKICLKAANSVQDVANRSCSLSWHARQHASVTPHIRHIFLSLLILSLCSTDNIANFSTVNSENDGWGGCQWRQNEEAERSMVDSER